MITLTIPEGEMGKKQMIKLNIELKEHKLHYCAKCKSIKSVNEFAILSAKNSVQPWCKECKNQTSRTYRAKNKAKRIILKEFMNSKKGSTKSLKALNKAMESIEHAFNVLDTCKIK